MHCFPKLQRVRYSFGQLLSVADFELEQTYFLEKTRLHNRLLHGSGIIVGLEVALSHSSIAVQPGCALDCVGNMIFVSEALEAKPPDGTDNPVYIMLHYRECETDLIPVVGEPCETGEQNIEASRITESFQLNYESGNPFQSHSLHFCGLHACGQPHGVPLARLSRTRSRWSIDGRFIAPRMVSCKGIKEDK
jgi:hypothetical protein